MEEVELLCHKKLWWNHSEIGYLYYQNQQMGKNLYYKQFPYTLIQKFMG